MAKTRTFVGIAPGGDIIERAERAMMRLRRFANNVKWVERENLHWTLQFLGEIDDQDVYDVCRAAEQAAMSVDPFSLVASGVGAFPSNERPRTLWIGASDGSEDFVDLHAALEKLLRPLGFRGENRRFVPHLTLGRAGRGIQTAESVALSEELTKLANFEAGTQVVDELTIYASRLRREGPEYAILSRIPLG